jgi:hypothetical protein
MGTDAADQTMFLGPRFQRGGPTTLQPEFAGPTKGNGLEEMFGG